MVNYMNQALPPLIFIGPSLDRNVAAPLLAADYRPPIRRGDLTQAIEAGYAFIGIVDGEFRQSLAISLQEIRTALAKGARLYGSSSMGALRAVEAFPLGMVGIGEIYWWFRSEKIDSDDEVAICFNAETGVALSEPLVNIRATLDAATQSEIIDADIREIVLLAAMQLPFPSRTYPNLAKQLKTLLSPRILRPLASFFQSSAVDLKADDAKLLLRVIKEDYERAGLRARQLPDSLAAFQDS